MSVQSGGFLQPGLKFIQLKNYQLTNANDSSSGQCFAIDQNNQVVFACCKNELIYVPFHSLLNFDAWTKELLKTVEAQLPARVVLKAGPDSLNCHLVSISSRGYGSKLALCSYDRSQASLFITFYDLKSLYQNKEQAVPYSRFNVSTTGPDEVHVRMLHWHPEISDNIFACCLTNGSFEVAYISDSDRSVLTVLAHYTTPRHVTSFAWSPKGKQIVVGFRDSTDSHFSQFKLPINEKNLVQNTPFDEVKKISLTEEFKGYHVVNICWLSTFNFVIICFNPQEDSTRYMLVSIPSAKATGDDAIMKIINFSCINIDTISGNRLEVNLLQLDNIIFTYTNRSDSFALLGCPTTADIGSHSKWDEVTLEDDSNLCLPAIGKDSASICGLAFAPGTQKQFRFSSSIVKGGPERHFALTYSTLGHLAVFLCDYETAENVNFLKVPTAPTILLKPTVSPTVQNLAVNPANVAPASNTTPAFALNASSQLKPTNSTPSLFGGQSTFNLGAPSALSTPQPNQSLTPKKAVTFASPSTEKNEASSTQSKPSALAALLASTDNPPAQKPQPKATSAVPAVAQPQQQPQPQPQPPPPAPKAEPNLEQLYAEEIQSSIAEFNKEFKGNLQSLKGILASGDIGTTEQFEKIKYEFDFINNMLDNLGDQYTSLNVDVNELQSTYLDLYYLCEETRSLLDRNTDPKYRSILRQRNLDPVTSRKVKEIYKLRDYIDVQLRELDNKFDLEWQEWLQKKRQSTGFLSPNSKARSIRSPPTAPHLSFISKKTNGNLDEDEQHLTKMLSKTLNNNQRLIESLRVQLNAKRGSLPLLNEKNGPRGSLGLNDSMGDSKNVNNLSKMFNESLRLNNSSIIKNQQPKKIVVTCMAPSQKSALKKFFESRHSVPIRVCGPCASVGLSSKSRFVSVLEKIKDKGKKQLAETPAVAPPTVSVSVPVLPSIASTSTTTSIVTSSTSTRTPSSSISSSQPPPSPVVSSAPAAAGKTKVSSTAPSEVKVPEAKALEAKPVSFSLPPKSTFSNAFGSFSLGANSLLSSLTQNTKPFGGGSQAGASLSSAPAASANVLALEKSKDKEKKQPAPVPSTVTVPSSTSTATSIFSTPSSSISSSKPPSAVVSSAPAVTGKTIVSSSEVKAPEAKAVSFSFSQALASKPSPFSVSNILTTTAPAPSTQTSSNPTSFSFSKAFGSTGLTATTTAATAPPAATSEPANSASFTFTLPPKSTAPSVFGAFSFGGNSVFSSPTPNTTPLGSQVGAAVSPVPTAGASASVLEKTKDNEKKPSPTVSPAASVLSSTPTATTTGSTSSSSVFNGQLLSAALSTAASPSSIFAPVSSAPAVVSNEAKVTSSEAKAPEAKAVSFSFSQAFASKATPFSGNNILTTTASAPSTQTSNPTSFSFSQAFASTGTAVAAAAAAAAPPAATSESANSASFTFTLPPKSTAPSAFGAFSFGGNSVFSSPTQNTTPFGGSFQTGAAVSPAPAAGASAIGFGSPAKFGSSPVFGQSPVFGNTQTFGGTPTFGGAATFGSTSPFSAGGTPSAFGVGVGGGQAPFANFNSNETFGSFAIKDADALSFGAFAADSGQANSGGFNQQQQQSQFSSPAFGHDASFTQRRK